VPTGPVYRFGAFELDVDRAALTNRGVDVPLRPKSFEVLRYLLAHQGVLVTKDQLFDAVWPGVVVTPDSINQCIIEIRKALGDDERNMIRTVPRRGFVFDIPVLVNQTTSEVLAESTTQLDDGDSWPQRRFRPLVIALLMGLTLVVSYLFVQHKDPSPVNGNSSVGRLGSDTKSIVVLPFTDMSPQRNQGFLTDGLTEELTTQLAKIGELRVISRTSAFAFKGKSVGASEIAQRLNVRYILEGSVRSDGHRIRVTAQLINAHEDNHLWADIYERPIEAIFQIQDEIIALIIRDLEVNVGDELPQIRRTDPAAYTLYLQSKVPVFTEEAIMESIEKLKQAVEIDPTFSTGWAALGSRYLTLYWNFNEPRETWELARNAANRALRLDPYCAPAHALLGKLETHDNRLQEAA
jgi:TolB-like protein/DNA-binding winged helix-turn-helix (wHTH) protein